MSARLGVQCWPHALEINPLHIEPLLHCRTAGLPYICNSCLYTVGKVSFTQERRLLLWMQGFLWSELHCFKVTWSWLEPTLPTQLLSCNTFHVDFLLCIFCIVLSSEKRSSIEGLSITDSQGDRLRHVWTPKDVRETNWPLDPNDIEFTNGLQQLQHYHKDVPITLPANKHLLTNYQRVRFQCPYIYPTSQFKYNNFSEPFPTIEIESRMCDVAWMSHSLFIPTAIKGKPHLAPISNCLHALVRKWVFSLRIMSLKQVDREHTAKIRRALRA